MTKKIYQLNDRTMKYKTLKQCRRQHYYLGIPGEFEARYPQEIAFPNMDAGRVDEYYSTKEGLLVNLEEESGDITEETLEKFGKYATFGEFMYSKNFYLAVICHKDPKDFPKCYKKSPSVYIKIHYYYFPQKELWAKYENVINKVEQKEELTDMEALDIAFIPKFISKDKAPFVTEYLAKTFKDAIITDNELKRDVGVILGAMILKNIKSDEKQNELMEDIGMKQIEEEIRILARDEYKEDYRKLEKEKYELQQENNAIKKEYDAIKKENNSIKKGILKLSKIDDLDPDAKKIINSLLIIH